MTAYGAALARPNFRRLFAAGLASSSGGAVTGVCILWVVFTSTRSPIAVGLVGTAELLAGVVFSLIGGGLVDRYDRRNLMVASDAVRCAVLVALVLELQLAGFRLPVILGAAFTISAFSTIFQPAEQTIVPAVVGPTLLADANGLVRSTQSIAQLAGASAGGLLIATVGPVVGLGYNALTFALSAVLVASLALGPEARRPRTHGLRTSFLAEVREGFRWLRGAAGLLELTISAGFFNFFATIVSGFLVVYATLVLHGSAVVFGGLLAVQLGAQGVGALAVGRIGAVRWAGRAWVVFYGVLSPLAAIALALVPNLGLAFVLLAIFGACGGFAGTAWLSAAQLTVPSEMQGRYFGVDGLGSWAILPAAQIGGGFLIAALGVRTTYLWAGLLWLAVGLAFLWPRALAAWGHPGRAGADGEAVGTGPAVADRPSSSDPMDGP